MRKNSMVTSIIGGAAALAILGSGVANATPRPDPTPAYYALCGTVYSGAALVDNYHGGGGVSVGIPNTATRVSGVTVVATASSTFLGTSMSTSTVSDANGEFCLQGDYTWLLTVGATTGKLVLTTPGVTSTQQHPGPTGINSTQLNAHTLAGGGATGFNLVVS